MLAACCEQQRLAPFTIEGACHRVVFETWLETGCIPALQLGPAGMGDHATCHHGGHMAALSAAAGCRRLSLPP